MNLIPQTLTLVSQPRASHQRDGWSLYSALSERVEYESTLAWATAPEQPFTPVRELPVERPDTLSLIRFVSGFLP